MPHSINRVRLGIVGLVAALALAGASVLASATGASAAPAKETAQESVAVVQVAAAAPAKGKAAQTFTVLSAEKGSGDLTINAPLAGFCGDFRQDGATFIMGCSVILPFATIYLFCTNGNIFAGTFAAGVYELTATPCIGYEYYVV